MMKIRKNAPSLAIILLALGGLALGYHYVTGREFTEDMVDGRGRPTTEKAKASGVPLWASEDWSWTGKEWGGAGALNLARLYNKFYIKSVVVVEKQLTCTSIVYHFTILKVPRTYQTRLFILLFRNRTIFQQH